MASSPLPQTSMVFTEASPAAPEEETGTGGSDWKCRSLGTRETVKTVKKSSGQFDTHINVGVNETGFLMLTGHTL
jgi:hypothetical protein